MKIKTKLSLGLGFLFAVILLMGGLGIAYLHKLSYQSKETLKDNYESIMYAQNMLRIIDSDGLESDTAAFEKHLVLQEANITEVGEKELTAELRANFDKLKSLSSVAVTNVLPAMRSLLYRISDTNLNAIVRKNEQTNASVNEAIVYMSVIGTITILITLTFIVNFPGYIANPIHALTESIKEIAKKNYETRLHFKSNDEFGDLASAFNEMASRLDGYEHSNLAEILFQKKRIEALINNMHDPVVGLDENNRILFANTEALLVMGLGAAGTIGSYAPDLALKNDLFRAIINGEKNGQHLKIFSGNKESYFARDVIEIISDEKRIGKVYILKNVTDFKELDAAKTNFIATISHELKTPIASIKMCAQLLNDNRVGTLNAEQKGIIQTVNAEVQRLLHITGELLDLAQVETGNISLHYQQVMPSEIINYAYQALKFQADQKQISLEIDIENELPPLNADLEKTAWVLVNFLSNAIRYSAENSTIILSAKGGASTVVFSVRDFGKGIPQKHKDKIFDKFYKIPEPNAPYKGTGLGLAISKEFIVAQGGTIWVESEAGAGSTFSFSLTAA